MMMLAGLSQSREQGKLIEKASGAHLHPEASIFTLLGLQEALLPLESTKDNNRIRRIGIHSQSILHYLGIQPRGSLVSDGRVL